MTGAATDHGQHITYRTDAEVRRESLAADARILRARGASLRDIAAALAVSYETVRRWTT